MAQELDSTYWLAWIDKQESITEASYIAAYLAGDKSVKINDTENQNREGFLIIQAKIKQTQKNITGFPCCLFDKARQKVKQGDINDLILDVARIKHWAIYCKSAHQEGWREHLKKRQRPGR